MSEDKRLIDLDEAFETKFGGKKPSKLLMWLVKKVLHQDQLNKLILKTTGDGAEFCEQILKGLDITVEAEGLENIPADGTLYTFASNHPLGGVDGMTICSIIARNFGEPRMLVNDFLTFIHPLESLCIPINKVGAQARNLPILVDSAFKSSHQLLIFPAGLCSRKIDGTIKDLPWTKTFLTKSISTGRTIVPVHFIGRNTNRFYSVANICKKLGIKFNLAMIMLPGEMLRAKGKRFKVVFGKPIPASRFDSGKTQSQWVDYIRNQAYSL